MKNLISTLLVASFILALFSEASFASSKYKKCKVTEPGQSDSKGFTCEKTFGITYNKYFINDSCYNTLIEAEQVMKSSGVCNRKSSIGDYKILFTGQGDKARYECKTGFGIMYKGYFLDSNCYSTLSDAMDQLYKVSGKQVSL
jgi:hypothetical protein